MPISKSVTNNRKEVIIGGRDVGAGVNLHDYATSPLNLANLFQNSTEVSSPLESHQIETSFLLCICLYYYY